MAGTRWWSIASLCLAAAAFFPGARITSLRGAVEVQAAGQREWTPAVGGMLLRSGDHLRTGREAQVEVTSPDGTVSQFGPDSLARLDWGGEEPTTGRRTAYDIASGTVDLVTGAGLEVWVPKGKGILAPAATAGVQVRGRESTIRILHGEGRVETTRGQRIDLTGGDGARIDAAGHASRIRLPAAPALVAPLREARIAVASAVPSKVTLRWTKVPGALSYRLVLAVGSGFDAPLVDRQHLRSTFVELARLAEGTYVWRVSALDKDGLEGAFSDPATFTVMPVGSGAERQ